MKTKVAASKNGSSGKSIGISENYILWIGLLILFLGIWWVYQSALKNDFTNWDDNTYVYENPLLKMPASEAIPKMFAEPYYLLYTPLTLLSYGLNAWFQGANAQPYILTNILLHILNSLLIFLWMRQLKISIPAACIAGLAFGLHPMHVESVAWISERKDVLYTFFFIAAMMSWTQYRKSEDKKYYLFTLLLFILSCLSKPSAVVLPPVLIAIDYLLMGKLNLNKLGILIPLFIVSLIFGWILLYGVDTQGGKTHDDGFSSHTFGTFETIILAIYSYVWYPVKMLWPHPLNAFYAYPLNHQPLPWYMYASPILLLAIAGHTYYAWIKKQKDIVFMWVFFTITIFLFIKVLTTVGALTYDRYFYVASIGFCYILAKFFDQSKYKKFALPLLVPVLAIWAYLSHHRTTVWKDSYTLMSDMISMYPDHVPFAYNNRGLWLDKNNRNAEALENFKNAIRLDPMSPNAYLNAGRAFGQMQMPDSAIIYLEKVIRMDAADSKVYNNLGNAYGLKGNFMKAREAFTKSIELDPDNANAYYNLAVTYSMAGDTIQTDYWMQESARRGNAGAQNALQSRGKTW